MPQIKHRLTTLDVPAPRNESRPGNWDVAHALRTAVPVKDEQQRHDRALLRMCDTLDNLYPNDSAGN